MLQILSGINKNISSSSRMLSRIPFVFILIGIAVFFWVNGSSFFSSWNQNFSDLIMIYIVMMLIFMLWARRKTVKEYKTPVNMAMFSFTSFFMVTWVIMISLVKAGVIQGVNNSFNMELFYPMIILQICVVATAEELMFRGVIQDYVGLVPQAVVFAIWHSTAYQIYYYNSTFNWGALLIAFIMGLILGLVAKNKRFGLPGSIAIHSCYNLVVLGVLMI